MNVTKNVLHENLWSADDYHQHSSIQFDSAKKILGQASFAGNESILDIGCGDGKITKILSEMAPNGNVVGIDRSEKMIAFALENFHKNASKNLFFKLQDAEELDNRDEFDVIFSSYALHWIEDFSAFLKKAHTALKQQGKLIFTIPQGISAPLEQATKELLANNKWQVYFDKLKIAWKFQNEEAYANHLKNAGFTPKIFEVVQHKKIFASKADFENYVIQWYAYLAYLPQNKKADFFTEVSNRYFELQPLLDNGQVLFEFPRIDIIAIKN